MTTKSALLEEEGVSARAPAVFAVLCTKGLVGAWMRALSWSGKTPSRGLRRWLSFRRGGESFFACLSRSSAARSLASRASSSCVCVVTACFLAGRQYGDNCSPRKGAHFWWTFFARLSRSPSSLNRLSSSVMKLRATVLHTASGPRELH
jgi:hypothetical protein